MPFCNGADTGCVSAMDNITGARKRADFLQVLHTTELGKSAYETKQMTTAQAVGAVSDVFTYRNRTAERCARSEFPL